MLHLRPFAFAVLLGLILLPKAWSSAPAPTYQARTSPVFTFLFENDYFGGQDRHYTNGFKFSWLSADLAAWGQEGWRQRVIDRLPFINGPETQKNFGFAFGQFMFTPQDISRVPPDPLDRPYAGWTYLELSFIAKTATVMDTLSIQAGMVGPASQADEFQRAIHEWLSDQRPAGWNYQLENEFGLNIVYERKWRLFARSLHEFVGVDFVPHAGFSVGNVQTYGNAGFTLRVGFNLPNDFGVSLIRAAALTNGPLDDHDPRLGVWRRWSFFAFAGTDGRVVARDIFLDGNTFLDSPSVKREVLVGDAYYGLGLAWKGWQLTYTEAVRSKEFSGQIKENYFGSLALTRTF
jgi:lipid A 3-O-deacylase